MNLCTQGFPILSKNLQEKTIIDKVYNNRAQSEDILEADETMVQIAKKASDYTKEQLSNANTIELELNNDGDSEDKYGRLLAWVFVDGELLQKKLAQHHHLQISHLFQHMKAVGRRASWIQ